jgi:hypothetical protein
MRVLILLAFSCLIANLPTAMAQGTGGGGASSSSGGARGGGAPRLVSAILKSIRGVTRMLIPRRGPSMGPRQAARD